MRGVSSTSQNTRNQLFDGTVIERKMRKLSDNESNDSERYRDDSKVIVRYV